MSSRTVRGLSRRKVLISATAAVTAGLTCGLAGAETTRSRLGLVAYTCGLRRKQRQQETPSFDLFTPLTLLQHCQSLGAGGMQASLGVLPDEAVRELRDFAEQQQLFIEGIVSPPRDDADLSRFVAEIRTAAEVGALAVRTVVMPGRRYEQFRSLEEFRAAETIAREMLRRAAPVVERHRVRLAVENHKDQRIEERVTLLKDLSSEYVGACVDTGNSLALLDDPDEVVGALAPFAFSVHLKDQAVRECDDGFLLGDIPLGAGCLNLAGMVQRLRAARPDVRFQLELITRDPLRVPCLTEQYWATLPSAPGGDLARTLRLVREQRAPALQQVSSLPLPDQVALEAENIAASLRYAREHLGL